MCVLVVYCADEENPSVWGLSVAQLRSVGVRLVSGRKGVSPLVASPDVSIDGKAGKNTPTSLVGWFR